MPKVKKTDCTTVTVERHDPPPYVTVEHANNGRIIARPEGGRVKIGHTNLTSYCGYSLGHSGTGELNLSATEWREFVAHIERLLGA